MNESSYVRGRNLEDRTLRFAKDVRLFVRNLPKTLSNIEDAKQLIRSSGSIGANYIEANEALGKNDFLMRARISRKEAKEALYWLQLVTVGSDLEMTRQHQYLMKEVNELRAILSKIITNCGGSK